MSCCAVLIVRSRRRECTHARRRPLRRPSHLRERTASDAAASDASLKVIRDGSAKRLKGASVAGLAQIWSESYSYQTASKRLQTTTSSLDGQPSWSTGLTYDSYGREQTVSYPSGLVVKKGYTSYGDPSALSNNASGVSYWTQTAADAWGTPTIESYIGGITGRHASYASTGQLKQKKWSAGATLLDQWDYGYDSFGNLIRQERQGSGLAPAWETYAYDGMQRLLETSRIQPPNANCYTQPELCPPLTKYAYTPSGNLDAKSDYSAWAPGAYQYGAHGCGPHAVAKVARQVDGFGALDTYACDANGNVTGGNKLTASYDFNNQPWSVSRSGAGLAQFAYDSNGQRFKELATRHSTWFGPRGFERTQSASQTTDRHELGPVTVERNGGVDTVHANLRDRLGSTVALTNGGATLAATRAYDAFGKVRGNFFVERVGGTLDLQPATLRGFTGHEHVDDVRLIHMNGRMYDYQLGRFLSVDPIIQFPSNSQSLNPYSYILNNPLAGKDPSGYCSSATRSGNTLNCTFTPTGSHIPQTATGTIQSNGSVTNWSGGTTVGGKLMSGSTMLSVKVLDNGSVKSRQQSWTGPGKVETTDRVLSSSSRSNVQGSYEVTSEKNRQDTRDELGSMFDHLYGAGGSSYPVPEPELPLVPLYPLEDVALGGGAGKAAFGALGWIGRELSLLRGAGVGALEGANFAQRTFSPMFSKGGIFANRSVDDVAAALRSGAMKPSGVPIDFIVRDGNKLILNTRSAQALQAAGIPRLQWNAVNRTGQGAYENMLSGQLQRNGLTSEGIDTVRRSEGF